jgi:hypothetical protein
MRCAPRPLRLVGMRNPGRTWRIAEGAGRAPPAAKAPASLLIANARNFGGVGDALRPATS